MKKLVKRFLTVVAIAVIVVVVAIVIGIILFVRESLYGRGESGYIRYEPEVVKKYVPIDMSPPGFGIDEETIPDSAYVDTLQEAMQSTDIEMRDGQEFMRNIDKVLKEFRSDKYVTLHFLSENGNIEKGWTVARFKIKKIDGVEKYTFLENTSNVATKDDLYSYNTLETVKTNLVFSDVLQGLNVNPENTRFVYGYAHDKAIYTLKVEGYAPDGIVHYKVFDTDFYFWYYENLQSDKSGKSLTIELTQD